MNEKPILFSGEMVRAILEGKKTQTRRVIKPQPDHFHDFSDGKGWRPQIGEKEYPRPYQVGMMLWVRETWAALWPDVDPVPLRDCTIEYRADNPNAPYPGDWPADEARGNADAPKWRPSIFMPRLASRITLEVTGVRVERVQDISDDDAVEEGVDRTNTSIPTYARQRFQELWDSINGARGYGWDTNPWVWVVEFRRIETGSSDG